MLLLVTQSKLRLQRVQKTKMSLIFMFRLFEIGRFARTASTHVTRALDSIEEHGRRLSGGQARILSKIQLMLMRTELP